MASPATQSKRRPRELRRRVAVPARVRTGEQWGDACILNISSRGMLIQCARPVVEGSFVEVLHGDQLIVARVVWSQAGRTGVRSEERLAVEDILSLEQPRALQLIASNGLPRDPPRGGPGVAPDPRQRGRAIEFVAIGAIATVLASGLLVMAEAALAGPLASASAALGG